MLTQAELKHILDYNHDTGIFTWKNPHKQGRAKPGKPAGTIKLCGPVGSKRPYHYIHFGRKWYRSHRLAWLYMTGSWPEKEIDHINNNTHDNRFVNLREADHQQNGYNKKLQANNTSGVKGVYWDKSRCKWMARLNINGRMVNLGRFANIEDAIKKIMEEREKHHGEFCNHG